MIVETIFSTIDADGKPNFAPMGIVWGEELVMVRPYRDTRTYRNLLATGYGVANISDDVLAYVRCALYDAILPHFRAKAGPGVIFSSACSWRELGVVSREDPGERAEIRCRIVYEGWQKHFLGFRRASNAVIEATILATRLRLYDRDMVSERMAQYGEIVGKTGDDRDRQAFEMVHAFVQGGGQ